MAARSEWRRRWRSTERVLTASRRYAVTTYLDTKLLSHIFALSLHLDSFSVDSAALASDLGLAPSK